MTIDFTDYFLTDFPKNLSRNVFSLAYFRIEDEEARIVLSAKYHEYRQFYKVNLKAKTVKGFSLDPLRVALDSLIAELAQNKSVLTQSTVVAGLESRSIPLRAIIDELPPVIKWAFGDTTITTPSGDSFENGFQPFEEIKSNTHDFLFQELTLALQQLQQNTLLPYSSLIPYTTGQEYSRVESNVVVYYRVIQDMPIGTSPTDPAYAIKLIPDPLLIGDCRVFQDGLKVGANGFNQVDLIDGEDSGWYPMDGFSFDIGSDPYNAIVSLGAQRQAWRGINVIPGLLATLPNIQDHYLKMYSSTQAVGEFNIDTLKGHAHIQGYGIMGNHDERYGIATGLAPSVNSDADIQGGSSEPTSGAYTSTAMDDGVNGNPNVSDKTEPKGFAMTYAIYLGE